MEFYGCEWQLGDNIGGVEHHVACFTRQAEDEVCAAGEAVTVDEFDGVFCAGECVSAVDTKEGGIIGGFDTDFEDD